MADLLLYVALLILCGLTWFNTVKIERLFEILKEVINK